MSFIDAIKTCFKKYATFSGRARRSEYWFWWLFATIVSGVVAWIEGTDNYGLSSVVGLAFLLPNLAVAVRRMHDVGKSGWYLLWNFLPIVGNIMYLVKLCSDSEPGTNMYGENPKGVYASAAAQPYYAPEEPVYQQKAQEAVFTDYTTEPVSESTATTAGFCPYCDTPILVGQKFCTGCGHKIDV